MIAKAPTADMKASPYDRGEQKAVPSRLVQLTAQPKQRWIASRFNARTVGEDGRLILWNTYTGSVNVFAPENRERVLAALSGGISGSPDTYLAYLVKRGFLVADSVDEMQRFRLRYAREQWRSDALELTLLASEDCNFRCVYCYEKFARGTMQPEVRQGIRRYLLRRARRLNQLKISWFGGEPLYGWDAVEELSPFFRDVAEQHGIAHGQNMTTNAYLLTEERATKLLEWGCRSYQITVDGLAEQHDCKRVGRDGSPTYAVILDNLRSLRARRAEKFTVAIRVNFDMENTPHLEAFLEALSADFGGDPRFSLRFRPVGRWGGENDEELSPCGVADQRAVLERLRVQARELDLNQEGGIHEFKQFGSQVCYAARPYQFIVGATGKLMKCTIALDTVDANIVGQLHPDGRMELDDDRHAQWVAAHFESDKLCPNCYLVPICQGAACPMTRVLRNERTCCGVKSELKREMRFTLEQESGEQGGAVVGADRM